MKFIIPTDKNEVSKHIGKCEKFTIVEFLSDGQTVIYTKDNPKNYKPGYLPKLFSSMGISCIISGGAGSQAQELFKKYKIEILLGVTGTIDEIVDKLSNDIIVSGESLCKKTEKQCYNK